MARNRHSPINLISLFIMFTLFGCHIPLQPYVGAAITSHEQEQSVVLHQEVRIVSLSKASQGIASIELYINGELEHVERPPHGNPNEFIADQPWDPVQEGNVVVSVIAIDSQGNPSEPFSIELQVVQGISEMESTPTATQTTTPEGLSQTQTAQVGCTNEAAFVEHVTIPPNALLSAGSNFTKIWRVTNSGSCDWIGYQLIHVRGELMGGVSPKPLPMVSAGSLADIIMDMTAPNTPSTYSSIWQIRSSDGVVFGPELTLMITVPQSPTDTPLPTATFTPTATITPKPTITTTPTHTLTPTPTFTTTPTNTITPRPLSVEQIGEQITIPANSDEDTTVLCPSDSIVVSGGFDSENGVRIWHTMKNGNGWRVYARNTTSSSKTIHVYATCLHHSGGSTSHEMNQANTAPNDTSQLGVNCPTGSLVTGGGWVLGATNPIEITNSSRSGNGWRIFVNNSGDDDPLINVYAICLSGVSGTTTQVSDTSGEVPGDETEQLDKSCPFGAYVTGGGFETNIGVIIDNTSKLLNGWQNNARNTTSSKKQLTTYTICYSP